MVTTAMRMQTLATSYAQILEGVGGTPWVPLGNFQLDFFRNFPEPEQRAALIADPLFLPPSIDPSSDACKWALFCAASAEYLAEQYNIEKPAWAQEPILATPLNEPWYFSPMAYVREHIRLMEEQETPEPFARRNIFCGGDVYVDKYEKAQKFRASRSLRKTA